MDLSFDIVNSEGDQILVALSYYDSEIVRNLSEGVAESRLVFYDVTLVRKSGIGYVGYKVLSAVSDTLARFMDENEDAVLCFYCDAYSDVLRHHKEMLPQEYRSVLFSRMFDIYVRTKNVNDYVNHCVVIDDDEAPANKQFAHFICRKEHEAAVLTLGQTLMQK